MKLANGQDYNRIAEDILARTVWGEARGEGTEGMMAVAYVVLNRVKVAQEHGGKYWWGNNIVQVCQKPYQFSCWNHNDPNLAKLKQVDSKDSRFRQAILIGKLAVEGLMTDDITEGATHYHTIAIKPKWALGEVPVARVGNHLFYRLADD